MPSPHESNPSILVTFSGGPSFIVPADRMAFKDYPGEPIFVAFPLHDRSHTIAHGAHAVITIGAMWNNDGIFDHHATQYYVYPHWDVDETCALLGLERSEIPIASIVFQR